jgi:hypothetical protein
MEFQHQYNICLWFRRMSRSLIMITDEFAITRESHKSGNAEISLEMIVCGNNGCPKWEIFTIVENIPRTALFLIEHTSNFGHRVSVPHVISVWSILSSRVGARCDRLRFSISTWELRIDRSGDCFERIDQAEVFHQSSRFDSRALLACLHFNPFKAHIPKLFRKALWHFDLQKCSCRDSFSGMMCNKLFSSWCTRKQSWQCDRGVSIAV